MCGNIIKLGHCRASTIPCQGDNFFVTTRIQGFHGDSYCNGHKRSDSLELNRSRIRSLNQLRAAVLYHGCDISLDILCRDIVRIPQTGDFDGISLPFISLAKLRKQGGDDAENR